MQWRCSNKCHEQVAAASIDTIVTPVHCFSFNPCVHAMELLSHTSLFAEQCSSVGLCLPMPQDATTVTRSSAAQGVFPCKRVQKSSKE